MLVWFIYILYCIIYVSLVFILRNIVICYSGYYFYILCFTLMCKMLSFRSLGGDMWKMWNLGVRCNISSVEQTYINPPHIHCESNLTPHLNAFSVEVIYHPPNRHI